VKFWVTHCIAFCKAVNKIKLCYHLVSECQKASHFHRKLTHDLFTVTPTCSFSCTPMRIWRSNASQIFDLRKTSLICAMPPLQKRGKNSTNCNKIGQDTKICNQKSEISTWTQTLYSHIWMSKSVAQQWEEVTKHTDESEDRQ